ncbi:MAG: T9SS type A sorting domain-containing protein [Bacteroidota bacterium]
MKESVHLDRLQNIISPLLRSATPLFFLLLFLSSARAEKADFAIIQPLPDITVSCDFTFPFNPNDPNQYVNDFNAIFGRVRVGTTGGRDSINIVDRVCPAHPRFSEFAPSSIFTDPCYDDSYRIFWGYDGYVLGHGTIPLQQNIVPQLNCSRGKIIREWRQHPSGPVITSQTIHIIDCKEFYVPTVCWRFTANDVGSCDLVNIGGSQQYRTKLVEWPCNVDITTCQQQGNDLFLPENLPVTSEQDRRPRVDDDRCSLLATSYTDQVFPAVDSVCVKVFRTWKLIDWCLFHDQMNGLYNGPFEWTFTQVIKLSNLDAPDFANCEDQTFCGFGDPNSDNDCTGVIELRPQISDDCTLNADLRIDYKIDLFDDGNLDLLGYSDNQGNIYPFPNPNNLPVATFDATNPQADGLYPVGTHRILWGAEDGCGNAAICGYDFTIEDCKPPTAYCEVGISTIPMPNSAGGFVDIWASDFDLGSVDNCTAAEDLDFSFSTDRADRSRRLTCADADSTLSFTVFVWDEADNYSSCLVGVILNCDSTGNSFNISANFENEEGQGIGGVSVRVSNADGDEAILSLNPNTGQLFGFPGITFDGPYTIRPSKNINPLNGVTTFDMVLIAKHILGVEALSSPYKIIAADLNGSNTITTFDLVRLRQVILYINTDFGDVESWRFVDANYVFPDPSNPFLEAFPEEITLDSLTQQSVIDFVGIKMGDVNCSADVENFSSQNTEDRYRSQPLLLHSPDRALKAGQSYDITFYGDDMAAALGSQFALSFDPQALAFEAVEPRQTAWNRDNFGLQFLDRGVLLASWSQAQAVAMEETPLFTLRLRALRDGQLSELLALSTDYLQAEAYSDATDPADIGIHDIELRFDPAAPTAFTAFGLQANRPNPFRQTTTIGFTLPEAGATSLKVYDTLGRLLVERKGSYDQGYHEVELNAADLGGAGVYYYTLEAAGQRVGKHMVVN